MMESVRGGGGGGGGGVKVVLGENIYIYVGQLNANQRRRG